MQNIQKSVMKHFLFIIRNKSNIVVDKISTKRGNADIFRFLIYTTIVI